ncbi:para-aminobenzoate synthetase [Austwickia chelonae]|uniref:aminodeoxychorismate synthase n=1 Tax=Austwickia chelonae NBRC 105200 TaxID=1184607 RepID=K6W9V0_9MICO|nr:aminodeoxychorismate synthase component I [Austwickia chelonae]GAB78607.1 para-aminobenzoate synthase [Austwickia chelonae NBRC 105200]SEW34082.1 para-aminobenzoate synthetase [Austwickia chelonae]
MLSVPSSASSVLVVDNDDSFTYNLVDLFRAAGCRVDVVTNRDRAVLSVLDRYDAVVLSPGPGSPHVAEDVGICLDVLEGAPLPVLGVCLGHQTMAVAAGGTVGRSPEPAHGLIVEVAHDGRGLFAGLTGPFAATRYHSLEIVDLPDLLEATAWGPDGGVQGVRHRLAPWWGVQFHPESVGTEVGALLVRNFLAAAQEWNRGHRPWRQVDFTYRVVPVEADPAAVYRALFAEASVSFWLDSSSAAAGVNVGEARWSFLGDASGPLSSVAVHDLGGGRVRVTGRGGERVFVGGFLDLLSQDLASRERWAAPPVPFPFVGGWVGYLGYETKAECGGGLRTSDGHPEAAMIFADRFVAVDHHTGLWYLGAWSHGGCAAEQESWLDEVEARLTGPVPVGASAGGLGGELCGPAGAVVRPRVSRAEYLALVERCRELIADGQSSEICLTTMLTTALAGRDPRVMYGRLRADNPAPYGAFLRLPGVDVLSTSPECFLRVDGEGTVVSMPIKGTRPRGATVQEDGDLLRELGESVKDRAENLMVVDLVRHDLTRTAVPGTTRVSELFGLRTYATVHQMVSTVCSRVAPGTDRVEVVRAAFPGGSMTGAPKVRTMALIDALEGAPRGVYSGAIGYFSLSGQVDLSIAIRTATVVGEEIRYGVGGAVTALSDPVEEYEEIVVKARPLTGLTGTPVEEDRC